MRTRVEAFAQAGRDPFVQRLYDYPRLAALARAAVNLVVPDRFVEVPVLRGPLRGVRICLNLRKEKAFWWGIYETWVQKRTCEVLIDGGRVWDVGACFGYHTLLMCKLCQPENVLAIEPDPDNRMRLIKNLRRNGFETARIVSAAAGAATGTGFLRKHSSDPGQSVVERSGKIGVEIITLDHLLDMYEPPDLIKVDVEGAEAEMFEGAARLLQDVRPVWILEAHGRQGERAVQSLRNHGYRVGGFGKGYEFPSDFPVGGPSHVFAEP